MAQDETTWRHRVRKRLLADGTTWYDIVEFFPAEEGGEESDGWTEAPIAPGGETLEELRQELTWMLEAFDEPPIETNEH